jgi:hypothetical protein
MAGDAASDGKQYPSSSRLVLPGFSKAPTWALQLCTALLAMYASMSLCTLGHLCPLSTADHHMHCTPMGLPLAPVPQGCYGPDGTCSACPERFWCNHNGDLQSFTNATTSSSMYVRFPPIPGVCISRMAPGKPCVPDGGIHQDNPCTQGYYCSQKQRVCLKQAVPGGECQETLDLDTSEPYNARSRQLNPNHNRCGRSDTGSDTLNGASMAGMLQQDPYRL